MNKKKTGKEGLRINLPKSTIRLILLYTFITAAFLIFIFYPEYKEGKTIETRNAELHTTLKKQKPLFEVYEKATELSEIEFEPELPFPEKSTFERDKLPVLSGIFADMAADSRMKLSGSSLDINRLKKRSATISITLVLEGSISHYREFLKSLLSVGYFQNIESIRIHPLDNNNKRFSTDILIAIKNKNSSSST